MLKGKIIVFTGKISITRQEAQALVSKHGGIPGSDVSKNTDILVVGEKPGSKLVRAQVLGIKVISEKEFWTFLVRVPEETPLTQEELAELEKRMTIQTCLGCGHQYKRWDTSPNTETCPSCGLLSSPTKCPHCSNDPVYVTDYNLYHCMLCGTWFKAPFSFHTRKTKHLHFFQPTSFQILEGIHKSCYACEHQVLLSSEDVEYGKRVYEKAPSLVKQWTEEAMVLREIKKKEMEALKFIESLTPEQINQLEKQLETKDENQ